MLRFFIRALGMLALACAFAAAVIDGARSLADREVMLTPFGVLLGRLFPAKIAALPALASRVGRWLWDPVLLDILYVPAFIDLAVLGLILMLLATPHSRRDRLRP